MELDDVYFSNGSAKKGPTEYYLIVKHCSEDSLGRVRRKAGSITLNGRNRKDLDAQLMKFSRRRDVRYIKPPKKGYRPCGSCMGFDAAQRKRCTRCLGRGVVKQPGSEGDQRV
jgi:hypothetical protein